jgi:hypothetical protein
VKTLIDRRLQARAARDAAWVSLIQTTTKRADPGQESAATIAAAGLPPEPHEREAATVARPHSLGHGADRMARYKMIRHRGTARTLRGAPSERDAQLRQAEGTGLSYSVTDRTRDAASQPTRAVRGRPRLEQRVKASHIEGTFRRALRRGLVGVDERDSGRLAARRTRLIGRRLSAPTPGTSVPLPGPARGC